MIFRGKSIATGALLQAEQIQRLAASGLRGARTAARRAAAVRGHGVTHGFRSNPDLHVWRGDWFGRFDR